ncbi:hypothetical protein [Burkholderia cepacia]|uniref:hypothetical protein n=1 Tax=Burkholderia cepacia TaxID=292 RepID=UPI00158ED790|nr:hypothetical protein [Burkholderia cepacia]
MIADVVASTVLDQSMPAQAMAFAMGFGSECVFWEIRGDHPDYAALGAALRTSRRRRNSSGRPAGSVMLGANHFAAPVGEIDRAVPYRS